MDSHKVLNHWTWTYKREKVQETRMINKTSKEWFSVIYSAWIISDLNFRSPAVLCVISSAATVTGRLIENISVDEYVLGGPTEILNYSWVWVCTHSSYPRILRDWEEHPFKDDVRFKLLVEGVQACICGDLVTAFEMMFATDYI